MDQQCNQYTAHHPTLIRVTVSNHKHAAFTELSRTGKRQDAVGANNMTLCPFIEHTPQGQYVCAGAQVPVFLGRRFIASA